jgi:putative oxidoreductase
VAHSTFLYEMSSHSGDFELECDNGRPPRQFSEFDGSSRNTHLTRSEGIAMRTSVVSRVKPLYKLFSSLSGKLRSPFLLAVRLYWGWQFAQSGWGKLHNISHVTDFFVSLNIPFPHMNAVFVSSLEFFGGILLLLGLASRFTGLVLTGNMLVAYITADKEALTSIFSDPGKFYTADPYTFLFASLLMLIFGAGLFSVDALIDRWADRPQVKTRTPWPTSQEPHAAGTLASLP